MVSSKRIKQLARDRKVLRGVDLFTLKFSKLDNLSSLIVDECRRSICDYNYPTYDHMWDTRRTMKKNGISRSFQPIPRLQKVTDTIIRENFNIEIRHAINRGPAYNYYTSKRNSHLGDWVCIPEPDRFTQPKYYYKVLLHELAHAACARTRLCLKFTESEEEIAVEMSSLIICFSTGYNMWDNCLSYMTNWSRDSNDNLCIRTKRQWDVLQSKTRRIVRYLIYGTDRL